MLRQLFDIFPGVGPRSAQRLHEAGFSTWQNALDHVDALPVGNQICTRLRTELPIAIAEYAKANPLHFDKAVKPKEAWRLFSAFPERCVFFDIETTGLSPHYDEITVVCTYSPHTRMFGRFVQGENLDQFPESIQEGQVLVGFNSCGFDLPFVRSRFGDRLPRVAHADLRWILYGMDIKGPLKDLESSVFDIRRPRSLQGFSGEEAVDAWHQWQRTGDRRLLNLLVLYCAADTFVMDYILREACRRNGCQRFCERLDPHCLFKTEKVGQWATALPDIPCPADLVPLVPATALEVATTVPDEPEDVLSDTEREYERIFLMALADESIAAEERLILDLFATMFGISATQQQDAERRAREFYAAHSLDGIAEMILNQERRQALQDLEQMTMFALSDGVLDGRERKVIGAVARGLKLTREEMDQIRLRAISRGKELTARMK